MHRILALLRSLVAALTVVTVAACSLPVRPTAHLLRSFGDRASSREAERMKPFEPADVVSTADLQYDPNDAGLKLDVFWPSSIDATDRRLTTIVWVHGGGWISGSKNFIAPYARILASHGFTVVTVDYTLAPEAQYPVPVHQVGAALRWLVAHADRLHIDPTRFVIAGDSAGGYIASQVVNIARSPDYAQLMGIEPAIDGRHIVGAMFYSSAYGINGGPLGPWIYRLYSGTLVRAYFGAQDDLEGRHMTGGVALGNFLTSDFPPTLVTAGNADPLEWQGRQFADRLKARGVRTETVFFDPDQRPVTEHEFQFRLDTEAGQLALAKTIAFLASLD